MKNKAEFYFIFLLVPFLCISQIDSSKRSFKLPVKQAPTYGYLMFGIGRTTPEGALASQNTKSDSSGLALNGLDLRLSFGYLFHNNFGVCASYFNQSFNLNTNAINDYFSKMYPGNSFSTSAVSNWKLKGALLGLYGRLALDENKTISIEPKVMIGLASGNAPEFTVTEYAKVSSGPAPYVTIDQSSGTSDPIIAYDVGVALRANIGTQFCIGVHVDYTALQKYTYYNNIKITYTSNLGSPPPPKTISYGQEMRSLALSASIGIRFGKRKLFE